MTDSSTAPRVVCGRAALIFASQIWTCHERVLGDDFASYATWYSDLFEKYTE